MQNNQIDLSGFEHPVIDGWIRDLNTAAYLLVDTPAGEEERLVVMGNDINNGAYQDFAVLPGYTYELKYKLAFGGSGTMNLKVNEGAATIASDSKTTNGSYTLNFTPTASTVRVHYAGNVKFMLNYIQLEYSHTDTIVTVSSPMAGYRYGFNGYERDDEVSGAGNSYTAEFWQYDSRLGRRWNIDPVVKHHESPYATFANNPIAFIDPNGKDTINVINKTGEMNRISGDGKDVFRIIDEAGKTLNTLEFDKGTIQYTWKYKNDSEDTDLPINVIQIKGNANTQKAFEFLATNTNVEWSFTATKRGSSQNGFLTTSHEKSTERGAVKLLNKKILIENYKIIQHTHNHPSNTPRPSGDGVNPKGFETDGNWGDRGFAKWLDAKYDSKYKNSDDFVPLIMYKIFLPATGRYIEYNEDGILKPINY